MSDKPLAFMVEDDVDLSTIFTLAGRQAGYDVKAFYDGRVALAEIVRTAPALVVLDFHLPGRSGPEALDQIQAFCTGTQVILCIADPRLAETLRGQMENILIKPVRFSQLRDLVAKLREAAKWE